jgi:hypothetical protein
LSSNRKERPINRPRENKEQEVEEELWCWVRTWEVELGRRVEPQAAPGGQQRPDHLGAGPGPRSGAVALGGRRRGRGPPERHAAQPPTPGLRGVLPFLPVLEPHLFRQQRQQLAAVCLGRGGAYGRGRFACLSISEEGRKKII